MVEVSKTLIMCFLCPETQLYKVQTSAVSLLYTGLIWLADIFHALLIVTIFQGDFELDINKKQLRQTGDHTTWKCLLFSRGQ